MSMNVYITAERKITFEKKDGKLNSGIQTEKFGVVQTPTDVTYEIVAKDDPIQAYKEYVKSLSNPETKPVFANDDIFGERDPIGETTWDWTEDHLKEFDEWLDRMDEGGYTVEVDVI